jgi:hypothetical protein
MITVVHIHLLIKLIFSDQKTSRPLGDLVTDKTDLDLYSEATLSNQLTDFGNSRAYQ